MQARESDLLARQDLKEDHLDKKPEKKWTTPKLKVFVCTKTEERILGACKQRGYVGPHVYPDYCHTPPACSGVGQS